LPDPISLIPAWLEATHDREVPTGLDVDEALRRAVLLRDQLRAGQIQAGEFEITEKSIETLHAFAALLTEQIKIDAETALADGRLIFDFVEAIAWTGTPFGGLGEFLARIAFLCWRSARLAGEPAEEQRWLRMYESVGKRAASLEAAEAILATPIEQRGDRVFEPYLEEVEQLFSIRILLWRLCETEPARVRDEANFFYRHLRERRSPLDVSGEQAHYLGEFALIAGGTCRLPSRREEARRWFELAEASFTPAHNASAHVARLAYQRLALALEERDLDLVFQRGPELSDRLMRFGLQEDALKCRFLEAHALKETDRLSDAKSVFQEIRDVAGAQGLDRLCGMASENLFQIHAFLGEVEEAMAEARKATVVLRALSNRVALAKLQAGVGYLLRGQGRMQEATAAFREAQRQFSAIQMTADVAATHLVLADLLLEAGQLAQAEWEVRAALPVIAELKLVPEGIAALALLRDSLRRRQIDRQALRDLHEHFGDKK